MLSVTCDGQPCSSNEACQSFTPVYSRLRRSTARRGAARRKHAACQNAAVPGRPSKRARSKISMTTTRAEGPLAYIAVHRIAVIDKRLPFEHAYCLAKLVFDHAGGPAKPEASGPVSLKSCKALAAEDLVRLSGEMTEVAAALVRLTVSAALLEVLDGIPEPAVVVEALDGNRRRKDQLVRRGDSGRARPRNLGPRFEGSVARALVGVILSGSARTGVRGWGTSPSCRCGGCALSGGLDHPYMAFRIVRIDDVIGVVRARAILQAIRACLGRARIRCRRSAAFPPTPTSRPRRGQRGSGHLAARVDPRRRRSAVVGAPVGCGSWRATVTSPARFFKRRPTRCRVAAWRAHRLAVCSLAP